MAQRRVTILIDDLTGQELSASESESVDFALDGHHYQIDVHRNSAATLRTALAPYIEAGRRLAPSSRPGAVITRLDTEPDPAAVRAWAAANRVQVSNRGRIPQSVVEQFKAAGN